MAETWLRALPGIREREPLKRHSWYGIGGPAEFFLEVSASDQLKDLLPRLGQDRIPYTVLGAGSNTLFMDEGLFGLTIKLTATAMSSRTDTVTAAAGLLMPRLAAEAARLGLAGLEFGAGVPGTVGGSVFGNAGAFGTEVKDRLIAAEAVDEQGIHHQLKLADCNFGYRSSAFKSGVAAGWVVVSATFMVTPGDPVGIRDQIRRVQKHRRLTQPIEKRSLGSTFKNPSGQAAGQLIDACGLKGFRIGAAEISAKHANFIINLGGASARDVLALMAEMQARVRDRFGIELEPEIRILANGSRA